MVEQTIIEQVKTKIAEMNSTTGSIDLFRAFITARHPEAANQVSGMQTYMREHGLLRQGRID